jgi:hypothetical protein
MLVADRVRRELGGDQGVFVTMTETLRANLLDARADATGKTRVWLALTFGSHVHHPAAKSWFDGLPNNAVCFFCRCMGRKRRK